MNNKNIFLACISLLSSSVLFAPAAPEPEPRTAELARTMIENLSRVIQLESQDSYLKEEFPSAMAQLAESDKRYQPFARSIQALENLGPDGEITNFGSATLLRLFTIGLALQTNGNPTEEIKNIGTTLTQACVKKLNSLQPGAHFTVEGLKQLCALGHVAAYRQLADAHAAQAEMQDLLRTTHHSIEETERDTVRRIGWAAVGASATTAGVLCAAHAIRAWRRVRTGAETIDIDERTREPLTIATLLSGSLGPIMAFIKPAIIFTFIVWIIYEIHKTFHAPCKRREDNLNRDFAAKLDKHKKKYDERLKKLAQECETAHSNLTEALANETMQARENSVAAMATVQKLDQGARQQLSEAATLLHSVEERIDAFAQIIARSGQTNSNLQQQQREIINDLRKVKQKLGIGGRNFWRFLRRRSGSFIGAGAGVGDVVVLLDKHSEGEEGPRQRRAHSLSPGMNSLPEGIGSNSPQVEAMRRRDALLSAGSGAGSGRVARKPPEPGFNGESDNK